MHSQTANHVFHETPKSCPKTPYCNRRAQQYKANPPHLFTENSDQNQNKKKKNLKDEYLNKTTNFAIVLNRVIYLFNNK